MAARRARADDRATDLRGSALSGQIPNLVNGTTVSVDHVVPQTWFQRSAQLYLNGDPVEDAVQCVLVTRSENSAKGNKPLHFGRTDAADLTDNADRSLYRLDAKDEPFFSEARQAVLARATCYAFLVYALVGEGGNDGWRSFAAATGCRYYASLHNPDATRASRRSARLPTLCRAQPSQELERTNALVLYYLHAWCNPCIFDAAFLDLPRVGALLVRRLRGATSLPEAMASGLRSVIAGFS